MIINSKFSSLFLGSNWRAPFDRETCYYQKFATGEIIRLQLIATDENLKSTLINESGVETDLTINLLRTIEGNDNKKLYEIVFSVGTPGAYIFRLSNEDETQGTETTFLVKEIADLSDTILLSYTHRRNDYDAIFVNDDSSAKIFNFRVEGGFYPGDKIQAVENEIFRDQFFKPMQTAAEAYEIKSLTIGSTRGVPQWVGNRVNNIFNLSEIAVNSVKTVRNESSVPEITKLLDKYPLYVFKINVEQTDEEEINFSSLLIFDGSFDQTFN